MLLQEYDRPNSAYMLFYERDDALEPVLIMDEMAASAPQEAASLATGIRVAEVAALSDKDSQVLTLYCHILLLGSLFMSRLQAKLGVIATLCRLTSLPYYQSQELLLVKPLLGAQHGEQSSSGIDVTVEALCHMNAARLACVSLLSK